MVEQRHGREGRPVEDELNSISTGESCNLESEIHAPRRPPMEEGYLGLRASLDWIKMSARNDTKKTINVPRECQTGPGAPGETAPDTREFP